MQKNLNIEKITFKVVQMKFLAMHITNQKLSFDIFTVGNLQNIFMEHDLNILIIFVIKEKCIILTHTMYCWLLLQIYLCYLWLLLCCRDIYVLGKEYEQNINFPNNSAHGVVCFLWLIRLNDFYLPGLSRTSLIYCNSTYQHLSDCPNHSEHFKCIGNFI